MPSEALRRLERYGRGGRDKSCVCRRSQSSRRDSYLLTGTLDHNYHLKRYAFRVFGAGRETGIVRLAHRWEIGGDGATS